MANDTRGNRQFSWLRQVAYRRDLLRQCSGVAIALTKYFNSEKMNGHGPRFTAFFNEGAWS